ncbi:MAG: DNA-processing protein DprA [Actinomycetales bacterium]|nr:DNA-processing protein DprA [Actinomycetales bacterium]
MPRMNYRGSEMRAALAALPDVDAWGDGAGAGAARGSGSGGPAGDADPIADRFARAAWAVVAEPGDRIAGRLRAAFGAQAALELVEREAPPEEVAELAAAGGDPELLAGAAWSTAWREALDRWRPRVERRLVDRALAQAARFRCGIATPADPDWPSPVDDLGPHAPVLLWYRGDRALLGVLSAGIAIVGARAATGYGEHVTAELAGGVADRGRAVISGAAYGIDGIAHRAALGGGGLTAAVMAGGLDRFYPSGHDRLLERVVQRGIALAEVPCGTAPTKWRFLQRNRIIAALAAATVVVEAGWRSGSLNTARHALQLGRPVGVVPGPVTSPASAGCHRMLRTDPVVCVTTVEEVLELAPLEVESPHPPGLHGPDLDATRSETGDPDGAARSDPESVRTRLLDALSERAARTPAQLAVASGLALDRVRAELGLLELDGRVRERARGWVRVAQDRPTPGAQSPGAQTAARQAPDGHAPDRRAG